MPDSRPPEKTPADAEGLLRDSAAMSAGSVHRNGSGNGSVDGDMDSLKELLFGAEKAELQRLASEIESTKFDTENLAKLLPGAFRSANASDDRLSESISPMIGSALKTSIKKDPQTIVDAISPIMGPAIRDSIRQAIRGMVQSLNKTLEYSVSTKGLQWRWEALTTGKKFAEVVLLHTLRYRVAQIFLIHRESGLLLQHVTDDEDIRDVDLASGMLTAIQDFVRDSFGADETESLKTMAFGNQTIWIETGPRAFLAAVIEGEAPSSLRDELNGCLESIHVDLREPLDSYKGNDAEFAPARPLMQDCLLTAYEHDDDGETQQEAQPLWKKTLWAMLLIGLVAGASYWISKSVAARRLSDIRRSLGVPPAVHAELDDGRLALIGPAKHDWIEEVKRTAHRMKHVSELDTSGLENLDAPWLEYVQRLKDESGIVVTEQRVSGNTYLIAGLRDPAAADPEALLSEYSIDTSRVSSSWQSYNSLGIEFLRERVIDAIAPPEDVNISGEGAVIVLSGKASEKWMTTARETSRAIGLGRIELKSENLSNVDVATLETQAARLESLYILHGVDKAELAGAQDETIDNAIRIIRELRSLSSIAGRRVRITIVGRSTQSEGRSLSQERASMLWRRFNDVKLGDDITIKGVHTKPLPDDSRATIPLDDILRSSTFSVTIQ